MNASKVIINAVLVLAGIALPLLLSACDSNGSKADEGFLSGADRAALYYRVIGSGQDTIVVVHGGPGAGMYTVLPPVQPLAERYVLIFYDQRGGGRSDLPADTTKLRPHYFVEDLEAVRSFFGLEQMNVLTHSFGSVLVARYAMQYPDRLKRLVFHGATGPRHEEAVRIIRAKAAAAPPPPDTVLQNRAAELLQSLLQGTASNPTEACRAYEEISAQIAIARGDSVDYDGTTCKAPPEAIHYYYRYTAQLAPKYFGGWDFTTGLESVSAPLLVVYGNRDSLAIPAQREWASAVPNGGLLLVPDAGKAAFSENPGLVFAAIETFFGGDWPATTEFAPE